MNYPLIALGSFGASIFFALLFHAPKRCILTAASIGTLAYMLHLFLLDKMGTAVGSVFLSSLLIAASSEIAARLQHAPASIFASVAIIPLVPGGGLYETMFHIVQREYDLAAAVGVETTLTSGCIALAIAVITAFSSARPRRRSE